MKSSDYSEIVPAPANYATSDTAEAELLKRRIAACLTDRFPKLKGIHVTVFGTSVAVRGKISSKNDKRLCLECCSQIPGVRRVVDELIVADEIETSHG
jgi:osmotically-inducible protein OsmY